MRDSYQREVDYLRLSVTSSCECHCPYCVPSGESPAPVPMVSAGRLAELACAATACGIHKVRLTGGEPLLRGDIVEICHKIAAIPGISELCVTTNGICLTQKALELKAAGVSRLNISLDTLIPERYHSLTGQNQLEQILKGIDAAWAAGFGHIKLNTVLMKGINDGELLDFIELTRNHPLDVRFIELMPIGPCSAFAQKHYISGDIVRALCPELHFLTQEGVAEYYALPGSQGRVGLIRPISHQFCDRCRRIRIDSMEQLHPCLFSEDTISLKGLHGIELEQAICLGIQQKPLCRSRNQLRTSPGQKMYQIGG